MYSYYFTIGFSHEPVTTRVLSRGLQSVYAVRLIRVKTGRSDDKRSEQTALFIRQALGSYPSLIVEDVVYDISSACSIAHIVSDLAVKMLQDVEQGRSVIVNLSGGPRILVLAALLAAIFAKSMKPNANVQVEITPEYAFGEGTTVDLTQFVSFVARGVEYLVSTVRNRDSLRRTLQVLSRHADGLTAKDIAKALDVKEVTASNYLSNLFQLDLIICDDTSPKKYKLSGPGEIIVTLLKQQRVL